MEQVHIFLTIIAIGLEIKNIMISRHVRHIETTVGTKHGRPAGYQGQHKRPKAPPVINY